MDASRGKSRRNGAVAGRPEVSLAEPLLDSAAAAALLNVRVSWVRDATRLGQLPCLRVGRHLRFTRVMLEGVAGRAVRRASCGGAGCRIRGRRVARGVRWGVSRSSREPRRRCWRALLRDRRRGRWSDGCS